MVEKEQQQKTINKKVALKLFVYFVFVLLSFLSLGWKFLSDGHEETKASAINHDLISFILLLYI